MQLGVESATPARVFDFVPTGAPTHATNSSWIGHSESTTDDASWVGGIAGSRRFGCMCNADNIEVKQCQLQQSKPLSTGSRPRLIYT